MKIYPRVACVVSPVERLASPEYHSDRAVDIISSGHCYLEAVLSSLTMLVLPSDLLLHPVIDM